MSAVHFVRLEELDMKDTRLSDFIAAVMIIGLGVMAIVISASLPAASTGLGSGGYPTVIGWCLIVLGAIQLVFTVRKGFANIQVHFDFTKMWPSAAVVACCFLYYFLLRKIGFLLLTPLLLFAVMWIFQYKKILPAAVISIVTTVTIYLLFTKVFMIFLPEFSLF